VYAVLTLKTAAIDTPNKVTILVTDDPAKRAPKSDKSSILQPFHKNFF
jgi:hypothetical protein